MTIPSLLVKQMSRLNFCLCYTFFYSGNQYFAIVKNSVFPHYLSKIASNLVIDFYRKRAAEKNNISNNIDEYIRKINEKKENNENEILRKTLNKLNEEQKEVIVLRFIEGYTTKEVAEIMNKSVDSIKSLQYRAVVKIRELLESREKVKI